MKVILSPHFRVGRSSAGDDDDSSASDDDDDDDDCDGDDDDDCNAARLPSPYAFPTGSCWNHR